MRAAVIGLGWWGKQIIKCLHDSKKIEITHAFDPMIGESDSIFSEYSVSMDSTECISEGNTWYPEYISKLTYLKEH